MEKIVDWVDKNYRWFLPLCVIGSGLILLLIGYINSI